jgi:uncharacterized membrane protein
VTASVALPQATARTRLIVATAVGLVVVAATLPAHRVAPLLGWDAAATTFCVWTWAMVWPMSPEETAQHSQQESPSRAWADAVLLGAALASLRAVGAVLTVAAKDSGAVKYAEAALAVASVALSWVLVHTVYTLTYARLYYAGTPGGVSFPGDEAPEYVDFAYLAFTLGMTFQVSDTALTSKAFRRAALHHAWLSFPLLTGIVAASVNLASGLAR